MITGLKKKLGGGSLPGFTGYQSGAGLNLAQVGRPAPVSIREKHARIQKYLYFV